MENENKQKQKKIIIIAALIVAVLAAVIFIFYYRSLIRATTMRILRIEGEVSLEDDGKSR